MIAEIKVPEIGESITEGILVEWMKSDGDFVSKDEDLYELETDKITMTIASESTGKLSIKVEAGSEVEIGQVVAQVDTDSVPAEVTTNEVAAEPVSAPVIANETPEPPAINPPAGIAQLDAKLSESGNLDTFAPSVRRLIIENDIDPARVVGTGKDGRITKGDVLHSMSDETGQKQPAKSQAVADTPVVKETSPPAPKPAAKIIPKTVDISDTGERQTRTPMSSLRIRIAERLIQSQQTAAILSTFNEVDMTNLMVIRKKYQESFVKKYGIKLGIMSFFVKAVVDALQTVPQVNAQIDGNDIIQNHYYDIGVAVSTEKGLVVPVIRDADKLDFAETELYIADLGKRARERSLTLDDLTGGVFTISNGGIFGSLLSTPILNPPQSGILGMHGIKKRPIVVGDDDHIEVRPMMYLAMSYDHRLIDGSEAVLFLRRVVECIGNPERIMLNV